MSKLSQKLAERLAVQQAIGRFAESTYREPELLLMGWGVEQGSPPQYALDIYDAYQMPASQIKALADALYGLAQEAYLEGINTQLTMFGLPVMGRVSDRQVLARLRAGVDASAQSVADTYHRKLANRVYSQWSGLPLRAAEGEPDPNEDDPDAIDESAPAEEAAPIDEPAPDALDAQVAAWVDVYAADKAAQVANYETAAYFNQGATDFHANNPGAAQTFHVEPEADTNTCAECMALLELGSVSAEDIVGVDFPIHVQCDHSWVPDPAEDWNPNPDDVWAAQGDAEAGDIAAAEPQRLGGEAAWRVYEAWWQKRDLLKFGGPGSGDYGHAGRPGQLGGSAAGGGGEQAAQARAYAQRTAQGPHVHGQSSFVDPSTGDYMTLTKAGTFGEQIFKGPISTRLAEIYGAPMHFVSGSDNEAHSNAFPIDARADSKTGIEIKTYNADEVNGIRTRIPTKYLTSKRDYLRSVGLQGAIVIQVVNQRTGEVTVYHHQGGEMGMENFSVPSGAELLGTWDMFSGREIKAAENFAEWLLRSFGHDASLKAWDVRGRGASGGDSEVNSALGGLREVSGVEFRPAIATARAASYGAFLSLYSAGEYGQMRNFLANDGKTGGALKDHGDGRLEIVSLFNLGGPKGAGLAMFDHLVKQGGNYAEAYGDKLRSLYESAGFAVNSSSKFDRAQAAPDWNYARDGEPNYYTLAKRVKLNERTPWTNNPTSLDRVKTNPTTISGAEPGSGSTPTTAAPKGSGSTSVRSGASRPQPDLEFGGPGSGDYGHAGRQGELGGSVPGSPPIGERGIAPRSAASSSAPGNRSWTGMPFDQREGEGPKASDTPPERTSSGDFVFYHGTSLGRAEQIIASGSLRHDDFHRVGLGTTPAAVSSYAAMAAIKDGTPRDSARLRLVLDKSWVSQQSVSHEIGGSGHDQFLFGPSHKLVGAAYQEAEKSYAIPASAIKSIGLHDVETAVPTAFVGRSDYQSPVPGYSERFPALTELWQLEFGGPGSGDHGHAGRPGERGGSAPGEAQVQGLNRALRIGAAQSNLQSLKARWSSINNDLLAHINQPDSAEAKAKLAELKQVALEMNHLHADPGGPRGVGLPGGPRDIVIVGAGPGGLSAAINGRADGLDVLVVDADVHAGGAAAHSSRIENFPGFPIGITGEQLAQTMYDQATRLGADTRLGVRATSITYDPSTDLKTVTLASGEAIETRTVILAGGVAMRKLDFPGSDSPSVIYGDAQALAERGKGGSVLVIGGSNGAAQAALGAARSSESVTVLARSDLSGMSDYQIGALRSSAKISVLEQDQIASFDATGVRTQKGQWLPDVKAVGVFAGGLPASDWLPADITRSGRAVAVDSNLATTLPGVYAVGDIRTGASQRILGAAADGQMAERNIWDYLDAQAKAAPLATPPPSTSPLRAAEAVSLDALTERLFQLDLANPYFPQLAEAQADALDFGSDASRKAWQARARGQSSALHYHVQVDVASGQASLLAHSHRNFGPPHSHKDDANISLSSPSLAERGLAEAALRLFQNRVAAAESEDLSTPDVVWQAADELDEMLEFGGPGSGFRGHLGRPGERGGSAPGGGRQDKRGNSLRVGDIVRHQVLGRVKILGLRNKMMQVEVERNGQAKQVFQHAVRRLEPAPGARPGGGPANPGVRPALDRNGLRIIPAPDNPLRPPAPGLGRAELAAHLRAEDARPGHIDRDQARGRLTVAQADLLRALHMDPTARAQATGIAAPVPEPPGRKPGPGERWPAVLGPWPPTDNVVGAKRMSEEGRIREGINKSYKLAFANGDAGVFKPAGGEDGQVGDAKQWRNEVAAYEVDTRLGLGVVPPTVAYDPAGQQFRLNNGHSVESLGIGSLQYFAFGSQGYENQNAVGAFWKAQDSYSAGDMERMAVLDYVLENKDRHALNWRTSPSGGVIAIDNGLGLYNPEHVGNGAAQMRNTFGFALEDKLGGNFKFSEELTAKLAAVDSAGLGAKLTEMGYDKAIVDGVLERLKDVQTNGATAVGRAGFRDRHPNGVQWEPAAGRLPGRVRQARAANLEHSHAPNFEGRHARTTVMQHLVERHGMVPDGVRRLLVQGDNLNLHHGRLHGRTGATGPALGPG